MNVMCISDGDMHLGSVMSIWRRASSLGQTLEIDEMAKGLLDWKLSRADRY